MSEVRIISICEAYPQGEEAILAAIKSPGIGFAEHVNFTQFVSHLHAGTGMLSRLMELGISEDWDRHDLGMALLELNRDFEIETYLFELQRHNVAAEVFGSLPNLKMAYMRCYKEMFGYPDSDKYDDFILKDLELLTRGYDNWGRKFLKVCINALEQYE